jgi:hypothetical protein
MLSYPYGYTIHQPDPKDCPHDSFPEYRPRLTAFGSP